MAVISGKSLFTIITEKQENSVYSKPTNAFGTTVNEQMSGR
jgi:hypothetical protein